MQELTNVQRLSKRVAGLKPSGIRKFFDIAATMKDVISLGIGEPDFTTPKPILEAGIRSLQHGETHYTSNSGKLELRRAIADNIERLYGVKYDPVNEIIAAGGVSIEIPARMEDDFQVDPARIAAAITHRTKAIFIGYPSNPTGAVATRETLLEIAKLAQQNDLVLISDEIYDRLVYN